MKTMKTVESRVLQILRDCPETRNEDMLLFYRYYNRFADYLRAGELPLEDLAYNYKAWVTHRAVTSTILSVLKAQINRKYTCMNVRLTLFPMRP